GSQELAERVLARWEELFPADDAQTLRLRFELGNTFRARGEVDRSYEIDSDAYQRMTAALGEKHPYTLMSGGGLAADLLELGDYPQARELDEKTFTGLREVLGPNHERAMTAANNLAVSLRLTGSVVEATAYDKDNLARGRRHLGARNVRTLHYAMNYGRD